MAEIRIDTSSLTYTQFLIPGHSSGFVDGAGGLTISLAPGVYGFKQISGQPAGFEFDVTQDGLVDYDPANEPFLDGRGTSTLTVRGYAVTLDGRSLSHDLLPIVIGASELTRDRTHELTYIPAAGYGFQPAAGIAADFRFALTVEGQVVVDARYAGFAQAAGRVLTISGYRVTIDGRALSHDLIPLAMLGGSSELPNDTTHELTLIPAAGYRFQPAWGIAADFRFDLSVDGQVSVAELFEVLRGVRALLEGARPLTAGDLALPDTVVAEPIEDPALATRAQNAVAALQRAAQDLAAGAGDAILHRGLRRAAHLGVPGALPGDVALRPHADLVAAELTRRRDTLAQLTAQRTAGELTQLAYDRARLQAVFGDGFRVLPAVSLPDATLTTALRGSTQTQGGDALAAVGWLQRVARVRRGADRLVAALAYAEALRTGSVLTLDVAQLPYTPGEGWLGLPFDGDPPGNRLSLLLHSPRGVGETVAGLAVDEWTEVIPSRSETTGVAFHFDAPGACAPQAVLLAVSPDDRAQWSTELLEDTLAEALSLARVRMVDLEALHPIEPDAMTDIGQLLPAAHLATNVASPPPQPPGQPPQPGDAIATDLTRGGG